MSVPRYGWQSGNNAHVGTDGLVHPGLSTEDLLAEQAALAARIQTAKDKELPMLKGNGFIVIDPSNPRFDGEEFTDIEDARAHASNVAYKSGSAIIYAPFAVTRPKRDTLESVPSKLLEQLNLSGGKKGGMTAIGPTPSSIGKDG